MGFLFYLHTTQTWPSLAMDDQYGLQALQRKGQHISYCLTSKHRFLTNFDTNCFQAMYCMSHHFETSRGNNLYTVPNKSALREKKKSWGLCHLIKSHISYYIKKKKNKHNFIYCNFFLKYIPMRKKKKSTHYF